MGNLHVQLLKAWIAAVEISLAGRMQGTPLVPYLRFWGFGGPKTVNPQTFGVLALVDGFGISVLLGGVRGVRMEGPSVGGGEDAKL